MLGNFNIISICAFALITAFISITIKYYSKPYYILVLIISGVALLMYVLNNSIHIFEKINFILENSHIPPCYSQALFKSIGICLISQFTVDACRDAGENSLANKIDFAGKIALLTVIIPILEQIIQSSINIMGVD